VGRQSLQREESLVVLVALFLGLSCEKQCCIGSRATDLQACFSHDRLLRIACFAYQGILCEEGRPPFGHDYTFDLGVPF